MRAAVLFSGGKDSAYSLYKEKDNYEIVCLISLFPEKPDSYMFHYPNVKFIKYQAESLNLPLIIQNTKAEKENWCRQRLMPSTLLPCRRRWVGGPAQKAGEIKQLRIPGRVSNLKRSDFGNIQADRYSAKRAEAKN